MKPSLTYEWTLFRISKLLLDPSSEWTELLDARPEKYALKMTKIKAQIDWLKNWFMIFVELLVPNGSLFLSQMAQWVLFEESAHAVGYVMRRGEWLSIL